MYIALAEAVSQSYLSSSIEKLHVDSRLQLLG
jgi:hypothetical protein